MLFKLKYYLAAAFKTLLFAVVAGAAVFNLIYDDFMLYISDTHEYVYSDYTAGPVNINTASVHELQRISGIGAARAEAVVAYREEHGGFDSVDELINIPGIGAATLEKMRPQVTV